MDGKREVFVTGELQAEPWPPPVTCLACLVSLSDGWWPVEKKCNWSHHLLTYFLPAQGCRTQKVWGHGQGGVGARPPWVCTHRSQRRL